MSTKVSLKYEREETTGGWFHLYREVFDEDTYVYLEFGGVPFEAASSIDLSDKGPTSVSIRIPDAWARKLGLIKRSKPPSRSEPLPRLSP
jgi:hypothetical protein